MAISASPAACELTSRTGLGLEVGDIMDEYLVLEFPTEADAQACLDAINDMAATYWAEQGYTVVLEPVA